MNMHIRLAAKRGTRPPTIRFTDEHGRACLRVPLDPRGNHYAVVLQDDYQSVRDAGATGVWYLNRNSMGQAYVRTDVWSGGGRGTTLIVARIISGAGPRSTIFYANKDRLDLRPENLFWHRNGKAKRCDVMLAEDSAIYRAARDEARALSA